MRPAHCGCTIGVGADQPTRAAYSSPALAALTHTIACTPPIDPPRAIEAGLRAATHPPWHAPPASLDRRPLRC